MNYNLPKDCFRVGYARQCITPTEPVPLGGYGNVLTRYCDSVLIDIYTTCIAFTDEEDNTVLLFHNDLGGSGEELSVPIRKAVSKATGIPQTHILIAATHSHSAPAYTAPVPEAARYIEYLKAKMVAAAMEALADRKKAEMFLSKIDTQGLNFVRHYVLEDGSFKGDNFGDLNTSPYAGHTTQADPEMRVVKFAREGGKDVLLVNWQSHPHRTGGSRKYYVSSDIIGVMRNDLEATADCHFIYFTGGAGNINPTSRIKSENITKDYIEQGKALSMYARRACMEMTPAKTGKIRLCERLHHEPVARPDDSKLEHAMEVRALWEKTNDFRTCVALANQYGINSPYAACALIGHYNFPAETLMMPMYAFTIGDVGFVTAPYEMFDTNAKQIRDGSPFPMTIVASCANDANSYVPSAYGYQHGCYEADQTFFAPGTGEKFAQIYVDMLKEIYE